MLKQHLGRVATMWTHKFAQLVVRLVLDERPTVRSSRDYTNARLLQHLVRLVKHRSTLILLSENH